MKEVTKNEIPQTSERKEIDIKMPKGFAELLWNVDKSIEESQEVVLEGVDRINTFCEHINDTERWVQACNIIEDDLSLNNKAQVKIEKFNTNVV